MDCAEFLVKVAAVRAILEPIGLATEFIVAASFMIMVKLLLMIVEVNPPDAYGKVSSPLSVMVTCPLALSSPSNSLV